MHLQSKLWFTIWSYSLKYFCVSVLKSCLLSKIMHYSWTRTLSKYRTLSLKCLRKIQKCKCWERLNKTLIKALLVPRFAYDPLGIISPPMIINNGLYLKKHEITLLNLLCTTNVTLLLILLCDFLLLQGRTVLFVHSWLSTLCLLVL